MAGRSSSSANVSFDTNNPGEPPSSAHPLSSPVAPPCPPPPPTLLRPQPPWSTPPAVLPPYAPPLSPLALPSPPPPPPPLLRPRPRSRFPQVVFAQLLPSAPPISPPLAPPPTSVTPLQPHVPLAAPRLSPTLIQSQATATVRTSPPSTPQLPQSGTSNERNNFSETFDHLNNVFSNVKNPTPYLVILRPRLLFSKSIFGRVFYQIFVILNLIFALSLLLSSLFGNNQVHLWSIIISGTFVFITGVALALESIYIQTSDTWDSEGLGGQWNFEVLIYFSHLISVGFLVHGFLKHEVGPSNLEKYAVIFGIGVTLYLFLLLAYYYSRRTCNMKKLIPNISTMHLIAGGKNLEEAIEDFNEIFKKETKRLIHSGAKNKLEELYVAHEVIHQRLSRLLNTVS